MQGRPCLGRRSASCWWPLLAQGDPFFIPSYVGSKGWVGVRADHPDTSWEEVAELIATSYCLVAPKRLVREVVSPPPLDG